MFNSDCKKTIIPEEAKENALGKYDKMISTNIIEYARKETSFSQEERSFASKSNIIINNQTQKMLVIKQFKQPDDNKSIKKIDFYEEIDFNLGIKNGIVDHIEKIAAKQKNFFSNFATKYCAGCVEDTIEDFKKGINDTYLDIVYEVAKRDDLSLNDNTFEQIIENLNTKLDQDPDNYSIVEIKNYIKEIVKDMPPVDNRQKITQGTLIGNTVSFDERSYNIEKKEVATYNKQAAQTFQDQMNDYLGVYNGFSKKTDNVKMVNFNRLVIENIENNKYAINIGTHQYIIEKDNIESLTKHIIDNWEQYSNPPLPSAFITGNNIKNSIIKNNNDNSISNNNEGNSGNEHKKSPSIALLDNILYKEQPLSQNLFIKETMKHILEGANKHSLTLENELKVDFIDINDDNKKYSLTIDLNDNLKIKICIDDSNKNFVSDWNGKQKNLNINNILGVISSEKYYKLKEKYNISDQAELKLKTQNIPDYSGKFFVRNPDKKAKQLLDDILTLEQGNNDIFYFFSRNYKKLKELKGLNSNIEDRPIKSKIKTLFDKYKDDFTEDLSAIKTPFGLINADFINSFRTGQHALLGAITDCQKDKKNGYLLAATGMGKTKLLTETPGIIIDCSPEDENNFKNSTTNRVINITDDLPDIYEKIATASGLCSKKNGSDNKEFTIKQILETLEKNGREYRFLLNIVPNLYKEVKNPPVTIFTTNISKMDTAKFDDFTQNIGSLKELLVTLKIKSKDSETAKVNTLIVLEEAHRILNDSEEKKKDAQPTKKIAKQEQIDALKNNMIIAAHNENSNAFGENLKELFKLDPNLVKKMLSDTIGTNTKSNNLYDISEQITLSSNVNKLYNDFSKEIFGKNKKPLQNKKQKIEKELSNPQKIAELQKEGLNVFCLSATLPPIEDLYNNKILNKGTTKEFNPILPNVINTRPFKHIQLDNLDDVGNILTKTYSANNSFGSCSLILIENEEKRAKVSALFNDMIEDKPLEKQDLITKESFKAMVRIFQYQMLEKANSLRETDPSEADSIIEKIQHIEQLVNKITPINGCVIEGQGIRSIYENINDVLRIEKTENVTKTEKPHSVQKLFRKSFIEKGKQTFINTAKINIISLILNKNLNDTIKVTSPNIDSQKFYGDDIDMSKLGIDDFNLNGFAEKVINRTNNIADNVPGKNDIKGYYDLLSKIVAEAKKGTDNKENILQKINNVFQDKEILKLISDKYENLLKLSITNDDPNILVHTGIGTICTQKTAGTGLSSGLINNVCSDTTLELELLQNLGRGDRGPNFYIGNCTLTSVNPDHAKSLGAQTSYKQGTHIIDNRGKRRPLTPRAKLFEGRNSGGLQI